MTYSIYRTRLAADDPMGLNPTPTLEQQLALWDKTLAENIFVICKTPMAKSITKRTLAGFRKAKVNTRYFEDLINQIINKPTNFIDKVKLGKTYWKANNNDNMKFNAIVGNPPYQVMDGGGTGSSAVPVYDKFVDIAKKANPEYFSMIMPSRWFSGGRGLDEFRDRMLNDNSINKIHDFLKAGDCFPNVEIKGGVCYFLWDKNYNGECEVNTHNGNLISKTTRSLLEVGADTFIRHNEAISIMNKVKSKKESSFSNLISANDPFGFDVREDNSYKRVRHNFETTYKEGDISVYYYGWQSQGVGYVSEKEITKNIELVKKFKVYISKAYGAGEVYPHQIINTPLFGDKNTCCTETYLAIGPFETKELTENVTSYMKTKFFRLLVLLIKNTQNAMKKVYKFVPLQDFTSTSDIDWSQSVPDIDRQLYAKYGLSDEEVAFIEGMIKGM
jgi:hypothetical protein